MIKLCDSSDYQSVIGRQLQIEIVQSQTVVRSSFIRVGSDLSIDRRPPTAEIIDREFYL